MKKNTKKPIYKRREILIGASALTAAGVITACKYNVKGAVTQLGLMGCDRNNWNNKDYFAYCISEKDEKYKH